jgi:hypothetical protein
VVATIVEILVDLLLRVAMIFAAASLSASWALLRSFRPRMVVLFATLGAGLFMAGSFCVFGPGWGPDFFHQFAGKFDFIWNTQFLPELQTTLAPENLTPETLAIMKTFFLKYFWFSIPALIAVGSVVTGLISYYLTSALLGRITTRVDPPLAFRFWVLPEPLIFGFLTGCVLKLFMPENSAWDIAGDNLLVFFIGLYTLEGLSIVSFYFHRWQFSRLWRIIIYSLLFQFCPFLIYIAASLSISDIWFDFRKLKTVPSGEKFL